MRTCRDREFPEIVAPENLFLLTMSRPKTAGERNESMMVEKAKKAMETTKDPVEKLRFVLRQTFVALKLIHCVT